MTWCVPVSAAAKPKQTRHQKITTLLENAPVPNTLSAAYFSLARRFLAGAPARGGLEEIAYRSFNHLSPQLRPTLACSVQYFYELNPAIKKQLFASKFDEHPERPLDAKWVAEQFADEWIAHVRKRNPNLLEPERAGRARLHNYTDPEMHDRAKVCRIRLVKDAKGVRTPDALSPTSTLEIHEVQQICTTVFFDGQPQPSCQEQTTDCPGEIFNSTLGPVCIKVLEAQGGEMVELTGVNFCSVDAKVILRPKGGGGIEREVDAHVIGDLTTPLTEIIDGETRLIEDCRVSDILYFQVPQDISPGRYYLDLLVPAQTTAGLVTLYGGPVTLDVRVPDTARFTISAEKLIARDETGETDWGSDEVRISVLAVPVLPTLDSSGLPQYGSVSTWNSNEFTDLDSGEERSITGGLLFSHTSPIGGVALSILGHEIDSDQAYAQQIKSFKDAFMMYLHDIWEFLKKEVVAALLAKYGKRIADMAVAHPWITAIAVIISFSVIAFMAMWAPADLIMQDDIGLTMIDLVSLTSGAYPNPPFRQYMTDGEVRVIAKPNSKGQTQYLEEREYSTGIAEWSKYSLFLRYNRVV
jgi:hypothetical protein